MLPAWDLSTVRAIGKKEPERSVLARCYLDHNDLTAARKEATDAMIDLPAGPDKQLAYLLLADVSMRLKDYRDARDACLTLLTGGVENTAMRDEALRLLGETYGHMKEYDKAALAYAGVFGQTGGILK